MLPAVGINASAPYRLQLPVLETLAFVALTLVFSVPLVAFGVALVLLINLPRNTPDISRRLLGMMVVVSLAMMISSLPISAEASSDIIGYYDLYEEYRSGDFDRLFQFGNGMEVGLPLLFYLWGLVLPKLSITGLMLCLSLTSGVVFWIWIEITFYGGNTRRADTALVGAALLLFNVFFSTQLARQFLSLVLLLYAFSAPTLARRLIFVVLAASFHLTALLFYGGYLLARKGTFGIALLIFLVMALRFYFPALLTLFDVLPAAVAEKLAYYVDNNSTFTDSDLGSFRLTGLLCIISLLAAAANGFKLSKQLRAWHAIPWVTIVIQLLLLPIPLATLRSTLLVHSVGTGVIAYKMISPRHRILLLATLNVLLLYKIAGLAALEGQTGFVSTMSVLMNAFA